MAIEILDKGACKAAGFLVTHPNTPVARCQGIARINPSGTNGFLTVDLIEPIGVNELVCLGAVMRDGLQGNRTVQFFVPDPVAEPQRIRIETFNPAGGLEAMSIWFAFFRLEGGQPAITPPPLPP